MPIVWRRVIKTAAVGGVALSSVVPMARTLNPPQPSSPLEGAWNVSPPTPSIAWRKLSISRNGFVVRTVS